VLAWSQPGATEVSPGEKLHACDDAWLMAGELNREWPFAQGARKLKSCDRRADVELKNSRKGSDLGGLGPLRLFPSGLSSYLTRRTGVTCGLSSASSAFTVLAQKSIASPRELTVASAPAASAMADRSVLPHRQTAIGTLMNLFRKRRTEYRTAAKLR
jgi:hypothetical protein